MAGSDPKQFDETYSAAYRHRLRRRAAPQGLLLIAPLGIAVAIAVALGPADHPDGDVRDTVAFRVLMTGFAVVGFGAMFVLSLWYLLSERPRSG